MYYKAESLKKQLRELIRSNTYARAHCFYVQKTRFGRWDNKKQETYQPKTRKEVKNQLKTMIAENHDLSTRKTASVLQYSQTLIVTVLHDDLHLKPYKFHN
jgi:hypothetical protein